jgi:hypothetical protein
LGSIEENSREAENGSHSGARKYDCEYSEIVIGMLGEDQFDHGAGGFNDFRVVRVMSISSQWCAAGPEHF